MTYELAKKLKDAGFPQKLDLHPAISFDDFEENKNDARGIAQVIQGCGIHLMYDSSCGETLEELRAKPITEWNGRGRPSYYFTREYIESSEGQELLVYSPTLSELIEACGEEFNFVCRNPKTGKWGSEPVTFQGFDNLRWSGFNSPEEAVANLWIALNK